ncbi:hypothetical protein DTO045G8_794 [Paecilomyces variotii]|nr:hypothetical protein DTO045G8_794 [Paecilomyces variotii]
MHFIQCLALILVFITSSSAGPVAHLLPRPRDFGSYNQTAWKPKATSSSTAIALQFLASSSAQVGQDGGRSSITPTHSSSVQLRGSSNIPSSTPVRTLSGTTSRTYRAHSTSSLLLSTSTPILQIIPVEEPTATSSSALSQTPSSTSLTVQIIQPLGSSGVVSPSLSLQFSNPVSRTASPVAYQPATGASSSSSSARSPARTPTSSRSSSHVYVQPTSSISANNGDGPAAEATITLPGLENGTTPGPKPTPSPTTSSTSSASSISNSISPSSQSSQTPSEPTIVVVTIQPSPASPAPSPADGGEKSSSSSYTPSPTNSITGKKATTTINPADTTTQTAAPASATPSDGNSSTGAAKTTSLEVTIIKTTSTRTVLVYPSPTTSTSQQPPAPVAQPTSSSKSTSTSTSSAMPDEISIVPVTPGLPTVTETVTETVTDKVQVTETMTVTTTLTGYY